MEAFVSLFKTMRCDGCNQAVHGTKYRCMECDGFIFCKRCQEGGIHSHHTIVNFTDAKQPRHRSMSSPAAVTLTDTVVGPKAFQATSPYDPVGRLHHQLAGPREKWGPPYDAGTQGPKHPSTTFLPYGIVPVAPSDAHPSTNPPTTKDEPICRQSSDVGNRRTTSEAMISSPSNCKSQSPYRNGKAPVAPPVPKPRKIAQRRKDLKSDDVYTATWAPAQSDSPFRRVPLSESDPEFQAVIQNMKQMGGQTFTGKVVQICRIENHRLYRTYKSCREDMTRFNDPGTVNERTLWHGTSAEVLSNIYRDGFNRSYCGKNATAYGDGVYFATSFDYSASPKYSPPDNRGRKYIFQCLVLTGHFTQGQPGLKEPPMRNEEFRYDSVVDDMSAPKMFVVFKDMQVYPEYVITLNL